MYLKILLMTAVLLSGQVFAQSASTDASSNATTPVVKAKKKKKKTAQAAAASSTAAPVAQVAQAEVVKKEEVKAAEAAKPLDLATAIAPLTVGELHTAQYVKDHFAASYHGEFYFVRRDIDSTDANQHNIQDVKIMHNPTLIYNPIKDWQILATAEFKYTDVPKPLAGTYVNNYHRSLFTVTKKNILVEKENGIKLDAGIGRRDYNTKTTPSTFGNDRVFATFTKTSGKNNASLFVQYLYNDPKVVTPITWKHGLEVIPTINIQLTEKLSYLFNDDINFNTSSGNTPRDMTMSHEMNVAYLNYQWTDKISTYYQFKYYHTELYTDGPQDKDDYFEHYAGIGYAITPKATVTFEVGSEIFHARDDRSFLAKKFSYPELAIYLDLAL